MRQLKAFLSRLTNPLVRANKQEALMLLAATIREELRKAINPPEATVYKQATLVLLAATLRGEIRKLADDPEGGHGSPSVLYGLGDVMHHVTEFLATGMNTDDPQYDELVAKLRLSARNLESLS